MDGVASQTVKGHHLSYGEALQCIRYLTHGG